MLVLCWPLLARSEHVRRIDDEYSVRVIMQPQPCRVEVVSNATKRTYITLATMVSCDVPVINRATGETVNIDWFGDYGRYQGSHKYIYNLAKRHAATRYEYHRFAVETARGATFYGKYNELPVALVHRAGAWTVRERPGDPPPLAAPTVPDAILRAVEGADPRRFVKTRSGAWLYVTAPQAERRGIYVIKARGRARFYPVPVPTQKLFAELRTRTGQLAFTPAPPSDLENYIGPFAFDGERLWFANGFYDGEGTSGVGAIGSFDPATGRYQMRHLPEIAPWSASAIHLEGSDLWIALMRQPEGYRYGAGVLLFNTTTGALRKYPIQDYVSTITRSGGTLYFGTVHGVYTLENERVTHIRIEPGRTGNRRVLSLTLP